MRTSHTKRVCQSERHQIRFDRNIKDAQGDLPWVTETMEVKRIPVDEKGNLSSRLDCKQLAVLYSPCMKLSHLTGPSLFIFGSCFSSASSDADSIFSPSVLWVHHPPHHRLVVIFCGSIEHLACFKKPDDRQCKTCSKSLADYKAGYRGDCDECRKKKSTEHHRSIRLDRENNYIQGLRRQRTREI